MSCCVVSLGWLRVEIMIPHIRLDPRRLLVEGAVANEHEDGEIDELSEAVVLHEA